MYNPEPATSFHKQKSWLVREIILCIIIFAAGMAVGYTLRGEQASGTDGSIDAALDESAKDDPTRGSADAKVTISQPAAEAANCAGAQGRYWEYQDQLWGTDAALDSASLRQYAQTVGLDMAAFDQCVSSNRYADEIRQDTLDGMRKGVNGTPAFLINDQLVPGMLPLDQFAAIVEQELAK
jgi:predicted DsbA family dithiol-disulfide isomerase